MDVLEDDQVHLLWRPSEMRYPAARQLDWHDWVAAAMSRALNRAARQAVR